jgi:hypothetical protein
VSFLKSESGAVTVDWVVLSASVVGIGLASVAATSDGVRALGQDVSTSLSSASVARLELRDLPSAFSSSFDEFSSAIRVYSSGDRTAGFSFSDALGSISGDKALVINSGGTRNGGSTFGGAVFSLDQEELVEGARYRVSYWARTDGPTHTMTLSNQSGSGDQSSLSHTSTLTGEWKQFTHEAVLNVSKPVVYIWTQGANQTVAIDDLKYERLP